jgi:hypothetical protein
VAITAIQLARYSDTFGDRKDEGKKLTSSYSAARTFSMRGEINDR